MERLKRELAPTAVARDAAGGSALAERQMLRDSGLLTLAVPRQWGGQQLAWPDILRLVRSLAEVDSSLAHLFGFQHLQVASILLFGSGAQQEKYLRATVDERWFWGNAVNARDTRLSVQKSGDGYVLDGLKSFCSGARDSDVLNVSFTLGTSPTERRFAVVPTHRAGIRVRDDWDNMGQRQTDSGTVAFDQVLIDQTDLLGPPGVASSPRATLRNLIGQLVLTEIYLGNARGALQSAVAYMSEHVQPWAMAGVDSAAQDPVMQLQAGDQWIQLQTAEALADRALERFQRAWDAGDALTAEQRGVLALDIAAARVHAGRVALQVTSEIFELTGARSTARRHGFDRYWRNVRVHTLHDPLDHRKKAVGRWLLTGEIPDPFGYG
ncbi:acyl-CoA dehydrogenase family protein [Diaphorobacter caeni]|uniref:acyl-CoA dehydrogenase family protein n=1 Tax=Diaphorobacter caeni TaxID=2784387 RepID=UPI00188EB4AA|nr:acyl-CoA dehydrogenase family protein [Diaphorobacter caeni]